jgi:hypothetical protein
MRVPPNRAVVIFGAVLVAAIAVQPVLAGTGLGAVFNLGRTNTMNGATTLRGNAATRILQVTNTGTGPALALSTKSTVPPMTVSSSTKVAHLNSDLLDGIDSTGFIQGSGKLSRGRLTEPLNSGNSAILAVAGFGSIEASCGVSGVPNYRLFWRNSSGGAVDLWYGEGSVTYVSPASGSGAYVAPIDQATDRVVRIVEGLPSGQMVRVTVAAHAGVGGCVFYAEATAG